jgi:WD40 repeat protein
VTDLLGKPVKVLKGHTGSIFYAQFSGKKIITCATDTTVRVWTIPEMEDHQKDFFDYEHPITSAALSPDGRQIVTGSGNGIGELWNVNGGLSKEIFKITNPIGPTAYNMGPSNFFISSVCFSPKGKSILTTSWDGIARIWPFINENTLGDPIPISKLRSNIISAVFSRGGDSILTVSSDGTANLWRVNNLSQPLQSYGHNILSAALSPDGTEILASYNDSTARLWSIKDSTRKKEFTSNPKSKIFGIAFSTDGQLIITGSEDKIARLWGRDQKLKKQLIGHLEKVSIVAFSADGTKIITGSDDGFIRLWQRRSTDWNNGDSIMLADKKLYLGVPAQINSLVLLDDGKSLLSSSGNMARLWDINLSQSEKLLNDGKLDAFINQFNEMSESQKEKYRTRAEARLHK